MARMIVTHRPPSIPFRTFRKSPAPRTSPYRVAPQFGYRIQNIMNGRSSHVPVPSPKSSGDPPGTNASLATALSIVAW